MVLFPAFFAVSAIRFSGLLEFKCENSTTSFAGCDRRDSVRREPV